jgi:hypothetical protein
MNDPSTADLHHGETANLEDLIDRESLREVCRSFFDLFGLSIRVFSARGALLANVHEERSICRYAELEQAAAHARGDQRRHLAAHAAASGRADQGDAHVARERLADLGASDQQLAGLPRHALHLQDRAREQALARERGQRSLVGGLPHYRVAADQRDRCVPGPDGHREVEGADYRHRAERVPLLHHAMPGALGRDGQPVQLSRQADGEVADVDHLLHFAAALFQDLPALDRHQLTERLLVRAQACTEAAYQLATARSWHAPQRDERARGLGDGLADVVGAGDRHRADQASVDGRPYLERSRDRVEVDTERS